MPILNKIRCDEKWSGGTFSVSAPLGKVVGTRRKREGKARVSRVVLLVVDACMNGMATAVTTAWLLWSHREEIKAAGSAASTAAWAAKRTYRWWYGNATPVNQFGSNGGSSSANNETMIIEMERVPRPSPPFEPAPRPQPQKRKGKGEGEKGEPGTEDRIECSAPSTPTASSGSDAEEHRQLRRAHRSSSLPSEIDLRHDYSLLDRLPHAEEDDYILIQKL